MRLNYLKDFEYEMDLLIDGGLEEGYLPIQIKQRLKSEFRLTEAEAQFVMAYSLEFHRKWKQCEKVGHKITHADSHITPESGTEWLTCGRCGMTETINWF